MFCLAVQMKASNPAKARERRGVKSICVPVRPDDQPVRRAKTSFRPWKRCRARRIRAEPTGVFRSSLRRTPASGKPGPDAGDGSATTRSTAPAGDGGLLGMAPFGAHVFGAASWGRPRDLRRGGSSRTLRRVRRFPASGSGSGDGASARGGESPRALPCAGRIGPIGSCVDGPSGS